MSLILLCTVAASEQENPYLYHPLINGFTFSFNKKNGKIHFICPVFPKSCQLIWHCHCLSGNIQHLHRSYCPGQICWLFNLPEVRIKDIKKKVCFALIRGRMAKACNATIIHTQQGHNAMLTSMWYVQRPVFSATLHQCDLIVLCQAGISGQFSILDSNSNLTFCWNLSKHARCLKCDCRPTTTLTPVAPREWIFFWGLVWKLTVDSTWKWIKFDQDDGEQLIRQNFWYRGSKLFGNTAHVLRPLGLTWCG